MVAILSAEPFNVLYKQPQFYSVSKSSLTGTLNTGGAWLDTWHMYHIIIYSLIRCPNVSQFMSPVQVLHQYNDALLDLLELLSWH